MSFAEDMGHDIEPPEHIKDTYITNNKIMENKSTFLPSNYSKPKVNSNYLRFEEGENKFRILSDAITGFIDWDKSGDKPKPIRTPEPQPALGENKVKHFWSFVIWDYKEQKVKILEITQSGIQEDIMALHGNEAWGNPQKYDLVITRKGKELDTKYSVVAIPPTDLDPEITRLYEALNLDLNKLFEGKDPFEDVKTEEPKEEVKF